MAKRKRGRHSRPASEQRRAAERGAARSEATHDTSLPEYARMASEGNAEAQRLLTDMARVMGEMVPELRDWMEPFRESSQPVDWPFLADLLMKALAEVPEDEVVGRLRVTEGEMQKATYKALGHKVMGVIYDQAAANATDPERIDIDALGEAAHAAREAATRLMQGDAADGDLQAVERYLGDVGRRDEVLEDFQRLGKAHGELSEALRQRLLGPLAEQIEASLEMEQADATGDNVYLTDPDLNERLARAAHRRGLEVAAFAQDAIDFWARQAGKEPPFTRHDVAAALAVSLLAAEEASDAPGERDKVRIPLPDEPDGAAVEVPLGEHRTVWMPTGTLRRFSEIAFGDGLEKALNHEQRMSLAPEGRHLVNGAQIIQGRNADGILMHYVRARMHLKFLAGLDHEVEVDLPMRQFGTFIDAIEARSGEHARMQERLPARVQPRGIEQPRWIGSRSFDSVWHRANEIASLAIFWSRNRSDRRFKEAGGWDDVQAAALGPRALVAIDALERMQQARVLAVDVDVFEGAPEWDDMADAFAWAEQARLPFDPLYLDLTAAGGLCPLVIADTDNRRNLVVKLHGALVWHDGTELTVLPVAWMPDMTNGHPNASGAYIGPTTGPRDAWGEWDFIGRVTFGGRPPEGMTYRLMRPDNEALGNLATVPVYAAPGGLAGRVEVLHEIHYEDDADAVREPERVGQMWANLALLCAGRVLSVLGMLEAMNVEVADPRPSNEDRRTMKRAMKRGWPIEIAKTVMVRPSKHRDRERRDDEAERRVYSHAFWRRGHYAFYPLGTRMADKLAEENPGDNRLVNHPEKGLCRKVHRGPVVIGAEGEHGERRAPVEKTRVWRKAPKPRHAIRREAA